MPRADKERLHAVLRAQDDPDLLARVPERRGAAALVRWLVEFPEQSRLGTPDGRDAEPEADVAGQADAPRVAKPLSVAQNGLWQRAQLAKRRDDAGHFAKAEEARHVWKPAGHAGRSLFEQLVCLQIPDDYARDYVRPVARERHVGPSEDAYIGPDGKQTYLRGQPELQGNRGLGAARPAMQCRNCHGEIFS